MDNIEIRNEDYKVLVVDDIPDNVILLNAFLRRAKFRVVTASDGPQALSKVGSEHPDLMLLDIMMPGMDGFEVLRRLQQDPAGKDLPVIVVTALSGQDDIARAFECGASDFITKPILYQNLITRITHQLRYSAALKAVRSYSEQLSRTIETRDRMYSVIAHDLRSPIGTLKMTFELLLEQLPMDMVGEDARSLLVDGSHVSEQTFLLLDNLLKWTKSQLGNLVPAVEDISLRDTIAFSSDYFRYMADTKRLTVSYDIPDNLVARCDAEMLKTVVRNLLSNAVKFSRAGSSIEISARPLEGNFLQVDVTDHGVWMSAERVSKFNSSQTLESTYGTSNEEGSGLGLMLCRELVAKNGGTISVSSVEGAGTTFSFTTVPAATPGR